MSRSFPHQGHVRLVLNTSSAIPQLPVLCDRAEHCWNGDHGRPNAIARLRYRQMYVPRIMEPIRKTALAGAGLTSWRYCPITVLDRQRVC
jgi:hypothetical protein